MFLENEVIERNFSKITFGPFSKVLTVNQSKIRSKSDYIKVKSSTNHSTDNFTATSNDNAQIHNKDTHHDSEPPNHMLKIFTPLTTINIENVAEVHDVQKSNQNPNHPPFNITGKHSHDIS